MILLLILFLFISTFILFILSRHDFVLLRQNISIRYIFDKAFIILLFVLLISRAAYFIDEGKYEFFFDPLSFLHVILFFGFNLLGFVSAFAIGVIVLFRKKKNVLRILDIYLISFFPITIFGAIEYILLGSRGNLIPYTYLGITIISYIILMKMHVGFKIRDGVVAFIILIFSAVSYLANSLYVKNAIVLYSPIQILAILVIAVSIYCLVLIQSDFFKEK